MMTGNTRKYEDFFFLHLEIITENQRVYRGKCFCDFKVLLDYY